MKQNIIILLLTVICCILGYMAAELGNRKPEQANQTEIISAASQTEGKFKAISYKEEVKKPIEDGGYINLPAPPYPTEALENGEEGTTRVEIVVEPDGRVSSTKIVKSSGFKRLDETALKAAQAGNIKPKSINGQPVRSRFVAPFTFKMSN